MYLKNKFIFFRLDSQNQHSSSRQLKSNFPILSNEETIATISEEKRKQIKFKEQEEKKRFKPKDEFESNQINEFHPKGQEKMKSKYFIIFF